MITRAIIGAVLGVITFILSLLPSANPEVTFWVADAGEYVSWAGHLFNLSTLSTVILIAISYELTMLTVRLALWIWRRVPIGG